VLERYKFIPLGKETAYSIECRELMVDSMVNFKRKYKGLNNLGKFTEKNILEIVEIACV
jgi:hypothetical protein